MNEAEQPESSEVDAADQHDPVGELHDTEQAMERLEVERDDLFARLQRVSADYQNYMKRAEQNLTEALDFARGDLLKTFIPLVDDFDRALENAPEDPGARAVHEGLRLLRDNFLKILEQTGVERIEARRGDPFDPHLHAALMQQADEDLQPNQIAAVMQCGYRYKGRTLRPAQVAVVPSA